MTEVTITIRNGWNTTMHYPDKQEIDVCPLCEGAALVQKNIKALSSIDDILTHLIHFRDKKQEYFVCLSLDGMQRLISRRIVTIGLLDKVLAHPREVFAGPITDRAASIIIAHNHPSGEAEPSDMDIQITQQLYASGQLLGIRLQDHIILTDSDHYSFKENFLL